MSIAHGLAVVGVLGRPLYVTSDVSGMFHIAKCEEGKDVQRASTLQCWL